MKDIDAKLRKCNSKIISILNNSHVGKDIVRMLRKQNKHNNFEDL